MKTLVKNGKKIKGFVYQTNDGSWWYAFGKPSQDNWIAFSCRDKSHGIACIQIPLLNQ